MKLCANPNSKSEMLLGKNNKKKTMNINVFRQHFDALPKNHKLMLGGITCLLLIAMLFPSADSTAGEEVANQGKVEPGKRVSVALPDTIQTDDSESILIDSAQLASRRQTSSVNNIGDSESSPISKQESKQDPIQAAENVADESIELTNNQDETKQVESANIALPEVALTEVSLLESSELSAEAVFAIKHSYQNGQPTELLPGQRYSLTIDESLLEAAESLPYEEPDWQTFVVKPGDNLAKIFSRAGLSAAEVHHVSRAGKDAKRLLKMRPGESIELLKSDDGSFEELNYAWSPTRTLNITLENNKYSSSIEEKEVYSRLHYASGEIRSNFWNAGVEAGLSDNQIMSLATIFGWDIDFALDIRSGDSFNVIFEENYIEGEFVGYGDIVAAEFTNQGEDFAAVRYKDGNYYTPEGRSMRKSFLRAPVSFKYISSNFNPRRFHPVLKRWKAHNGIDYAAKTGTPVVAAGDGRVIEAGYNRFNGNYVFIQHGDTYTTKYLHFSKRFVKKGQWVKQGQLIGNVGATGRVSGPHLHYEFLVNGKHKNPRTVKLPKALPIAKKEKAAFLALAKDYKAKLANNRRIMLAMN